MLGSLGFVCVFGERDLKLRVCLLQRDIIMGVEEKLNTRWPR